MMGWDSIKDTETDKNTGSAEQNISWETQGTEEITMGEINPTPRDPRDMPLETRSTHQGD